MTEISLDCSGTDLRDLLLIARALSKVERTDRLVPRDVKLFEKLLEPRFFFEILNARIDFEKIKAVRMGRFGLLEPIESFRSLTERVIGEGCFERK